MSAPRDGRATEFDEVLAVVRGGRFRAWLAVNAAMIETYEEIGALLNRKKVFHETWSKAGGLPSKALALPWECHLVLLEHCSTDRERFVFLDAALQGGWSAEELEERIHAGSP